MLELNSNRDNSIYFRKHIMYSFNNATNNISKITPEIMSISNMVGIKKLHFFNNLLEIDDSRYLQLGGWKGITISSAMYNNKSQITCIHDWTDFGGPRNVFLDNLNKYTGVNDMLFIEKEPNNVDLNIVPKSNIFYSCNDPNRTISLQHFLPKMTDVFIYITSCWNWEYLREETYQMFVELNLSILFETANSHDIETIKYWDSGLAVFILSKN